MGYQTPDLIQALTWHFVLKRVNHMYDACTERSRALYFEPKTKIPRI